MKILFLTLLTCLTLYGQSDVPLTLKAQFNGSHGYTIIGNTFNAFDNWLIPSPPCQILTQSSATLNLLPNQNVVAAYLYWSGIGDGLQDNEIKLNGINYSSSQTVVGYPEPNTFFSYFGAFHNVTNQVVSLGNGAYTFSDLDLNPLMNAYCSSSIYYGGWQMIIIYANQGLKKSVKKKEISFKKLV